MPCYPPDEQKRRDAQIEKLIARGILTPEGMLATILHGDDVDRERLEMLISHRFYTWEPRPDDPDDHEEQTAFVEDNTSSLAICLGGTGCLAAEQLVYVHGLGMVPVAEIDGPFVTWSRDEDGSGSYCLAMANAPFIKGAANLFEFRLSDGRSFKATAEHKVLTNQGWKTCREAVLSDALVDGCRLILGDHLRYGIFYDFTVHGTHCYVIDGIVHHNSGKTDAAAYKTAKYLKEKPPHRERCPFWVIGEKLDQVTNVCWNEKLSKLIDERDIADIRWLDNKLRRPRSVLLKHPTLAGKIGWVIEFKSYEQGIGSMKAESIGGFWCNEEVPYDLVLEIKGRCRDYNSPGWCDFTPIECKDPRWPDSYDNPKPGVRYYHLNTMRNPYISEEWIKDFFATVPEEMRELRTIGRFTSLAGQVYKEFRKKTHVIEPFNIPRDWRKYRGIDFGFNNYFACLWVAQDHDGRYYVYDEHYRNQTLIRDHAREINRRVWGTAGEEPYYCQTFSDHDPQVRSELSQHGIGCTPASKDVNAGIECVRGKMIIQGDGKPQLFIFDKCVNLIREILGYRYPEGGSIRSPSDEPMKVDDHAVDALRYVIYSSRTRSIAAQASGWKAHVDGKKHGVFGGRRAA